MQTKTAVIALMPDGLTVTTTQESLSAARHLPFTAASDAEQWLSVLKQAAPEFQALVKEMELEGAAARVLFDSPTQVVEQVSVKARSVNDAERAAALAGAESLPYPPSQAVSETFIIGRDRGESSFAQTHTLVAIERDDVAAAMVSLVESAGLKFLSATPMDAALTAGIVQDALAVGDSKARGRLYIGTHSSFFAVSSEGVLKFSRRLSIGLDAFVASMTRPIRISGRSEPIELDRKTATGLLAKFGIPHPDRPAQWPEHLTAHHLLPLLQPVLQRLVIELRQSLRFGMTEAERASLQIELAGPGSPLMGLAELIQTELSVGVNVTDRGAKSGEGPQWAAIELRDAMACSEALERLNLMPEALSASRKMGAMRRWLWTGAAAAMLLIVVDMMRIDSKLSQARQEADALAAENSQKQVLNVTQTRIIEALTAMNELQQRVDQEVAGRPNVRAFMQELARLTPPSIRLTALTVKRGADSVAGTATGYKFEISNDPAPMRLDEYVERLQQSPLLEGVTLRNVQITSVDDRAAQVFEVIFALRPAPDEATSTQVTQASPEGKP